MSPFRVKYGYNIMKNNMRQSLWRLLYEFTRLQARQCAILHQNGSTLWQIKEQHHRGATLEQIVVAIRVGIIWNFSIEQLPAPIFGPNLLCTEVWRIGEPSKNNE